MISQRPCIKQVNDLFAGDVSQALSRRTERQIFQPSFSWPLQRSLLLASCQIPKTECLVAGRADQPIGCAKAHEQDDVQVSRQRFLLRAGLRVPNIYGALVPTLGN